MKIKPEHLEIMRSKIAPYDTPELRAEYKAQGLSDKRYHRDLVYRTDLPVYSEGLTKFICDVLHPYLNDSHIDTALRKIVAPL